MRQIPDADSFAFTRKLAKPCSGHASRWHANRRRLGCERLAALVHTLDHPLALNLQALAWFMAGSNSNFESDSIP